MIPAPWHSANTVLDRMADAGFSPDEVVALLASHTIAVQRMIDPTIDVGNYSARNIYRYNSQCYRGCLWTQHRIYLILSSLQT